MDTKKDYRNFYNYDEELTPPTGKNLSGIIQKIMIGIAVAIVLFVIALITVVLLIIF